MDYFGGGVLVGLAVGIGITIIAVTFSFANIVDDCTDFGAFKIGMHKYECRRVEIE